MRLCRQASCRQFTRWRAPAGNASAMRQAGAGTRIKPMRLVNENGQESCQEREGEGRKPHPVVLREQVEHPAPGERPERAAHGMEREQEAHGETHDPEPHMGADDIGDDREGREIEQAEQRREGEQQNRIARDEHQQDETEGAQEIDRGQQGGPVEFVGRRAVADDPRRRGRGISTPNAVALSKTAENRRPPRRAGNGSGSRRWW